MPILRMRYSRAITAAIRRPSQITRERRVPCRSEAWQLFTSHVDARAALPRAGENDLVDDDGGDGGDGGGARTALKANVSFRRRATRSVDSSPTSAGRTSTRIHVGRTARRLLTIMVQEATGSGLKTREARSNRRALRGEIVRGDPSGIRSKGEPWKEVLDTLSGIGSPSRSDSCQSTSRTIFTLRARGRGNSAATGGAREIRDDNE